MRLDKMTMGKIKLAAAAVLIFTSGIAAAGAQGMPGMMQGGGMPMKHEGMGHEGMMSHEGMGHEGMGPGMMMCGMGTHIEGKLAYLRAELKITDAQMPLWNAFADAYRSNGQKRAQHCAAMKEHGGAMMPSDILDKLNMMEQHMTMHLESVRAIKATLQPLYAALSDEQKKTANEILKGPMGKM
jgi:LTXXQ motif family protein